MFHVVIPARFAATRLPGKPLLPIAGKPMVQWVWETARSSGAESVVIATDDARVLAAARGFGAECLMTSSEHASGTDRIAEVARARGLNDADVVVNVQGDEPLLPAALITAAADCLRQSAAIDIATIVTPIANLAEFENVNCVKALRALDGRALYFSRAAVPWPRDHATGGRPSLVEGAWRHVGLYAYRVRALLEFASWPPTALEVTERLEQLRALEHGMSIFLMPVGQAPPGGVDTPEDLERVRRVLSGSLGG